MWRSPCDIPRWSGFSVDAFFGGFSALTKFICNSFEDRGEHTPPPPRAPVLIAWARERSGICRFRPSRRGRDVRAALRRDS